LPDEAVTRSDLTAMPGHFPPMKSGSYVVHRTDWTAVMQSTFILDACETFTHAADTRAPDRIYERNSGAIN
jgi:hypothetical protein